MGFHILLTLDLLGLHCPGQAKKVVERAKAMAPPQHTAAAASSTLCKLLAWDADGLWQQARSPLLCCVCRVQGSSIPISSSSKPYLSVLRVRVDPVSCCILMVCKHQCQSWMLFNDLGHQHYSLEYTFAGAAAGRAGAATGAVANDAEALTVSANTNVERGSLLLAFVIMWQAVEGTAHD